MNESQETKDLNKLLANVAVLSQKVHNLHWNLKGQNFMEYHKLTDELYEGLNEFVDAIAEKIVMQNSLPLSTFKDYINNSLINEVEAKEWTTNDVAKIIYDDLETLSKVALEVKTNAFTQPLMDEVFLFIDKQRWFFKASK